MGQPLYLIFDNEFSTIPYLSGSEIPPNWTKLIKCYSEHVIDDEDELATN